MMRWVIVLTLLAGAGGYYYFQQHPEALPQQGQLKQLEALKEKVQDIAAQAKQRLTPSAKVATPPTGVLSPGKPDAEASPLAKFISSVVPAKLTNATPAPPPMINPVTLYLVNGGVVTGELVSETPKEVTLRFEYGDVGFRRSEIKRLVKGKEGTDDDNLVMPWEGQGLAWDYQCDVVIKLMRGTVLDVPMTSVTREAVVLTQTLPGGGVVEQTIPRADIEELQFRPIRNERSKAIEADLQTVFPNMHSYDEGMFTIVTDSPAPSVKDYRRTIRELATDWYLTFYPLVKSRKPMVQQYIVIFDSWVDYILFAFTDGLPGWMVVGYFNPENEVLYTFNMIGEWFSTLLEDAYLGDIREFRDKVSAQIKGSQYEDVIEGRLVEFLKKFETLHSLVRQVYRQQSEETLRHELVHAMFHNWKLQSIWLSKMPEQNKEELEKKRQYLQSDNIEEKRKLLQELLRQKPEQETPDLQAANAWFVEGLAEYMAPSTLRAIHEGRLHDAQEAVTQQRILPIEFLNAFKMGSFVGMTTGSKSYAYAQSWALCHFLMHRYPEGFLAFLDRMAGTPPTPEDDTLAWLVDAIGKEDKTLDQEFLDYLKQFPPEEPFWLQQWQQIIDFNNDLRTLAAQLWGG